MVPLHRLPGTHGLGLPRGSTSFNRNVRSPWGTDALRQGGRKWSEAYTGVLLCLWIACVRHGRRKSHAGQSTSGFAQATQPTFAVPSNLETIRIILDQCTCVCPRLRATRSIQPSLRSLYSAPLYRNTAQPILPPDLREKPRRPVKSDVGRLSRGNIEGYAR